MRLTPDDFENLDWDIGGTGIQMAHEKSAPNGASIEGAARASVTSRVFGAIILGL